jgi:Arc/MetJ-type ribon-helix-helix transcriptional regulator
MHEMHQPKAQAGVPMPPRNAVAMMTIFPYPEGDECGRRDCMAIQLTPEQERRVQDVISRGAYKSVEEVVDAALAAVEQRTVPGFAGTEEELDALLAEGLASKELAEDEFWDSVHAQTNALLAEHKTSPRS